MPAITSRVSLIVRSLERAAIRLPARYGPVLLRLSLGVVFLWFALPKFVPGLSPVDALARDTISALTLNLITGDLAIQLLGLLELGIALGLLTGRFLRLALAALIFQMAGTFSPLLLFPEQTWKAPFVLTLEGQFIVKNLVLLAAGIAIAGSTQRRGRPATSPLDVHQLDDEKPPRMAELSLSAARSR